MKQKLFYIPILLFLFIGIVTLYNETHAINNPVILSHIEGDNVFALEELEDNIYIIFGGNRIINNEDPLLFSRNKIEIKTLYKKLIIEYASSGNILTTIDVDGSLTISTTDFASTGVIEFRSLNSSFDLDMFGEVYLYFEKSEEISKPPIDLKLIVDVNHPEGIEDINSLFIAWDNYDGDITHLIDVEVDEYTPNKTKTGTYLVTLVVADSSNNTTRLNYYITVKDMDAPVVEKPNDINISYTKTLSMDELIMDIVATDNYSTNIDITIESQNYEQTPNVVGSYTVIIKVDDNEGNITFVERTINVIDDVAPVIDGKFEYKITTEDTLSINEIINGLIINDEVDKDLLVPYIISNNYNLNQKGDHELLIGVKDKFNNESTRKITITITDEIAPVFYIKIPPIMIHQNTTYHVDELLELIESKMAFKLDNLTINLNEYTHNENKPGIYRIKLSGYSVDERIDIETFIRVNEQILEEEPIKDTKHTNYLLVVLGASVGLGLTSITVIWFIKKRRVL
ncbi:hypothetical protein [Acholeplasma granularum]|uniref:hypothetical protein n=1 Tax=Acholeplasma granularum TaxID=264635 RepID=UPI000472626E|nr:hypothetical protein [Acholeplasma granularum]